MTPYHRDDQQLFRDCKYHPGIRTVRLVRVDLNWSYSHPVYGKSHPQFGEVVGPNIDTVMVCAGVSRLLDQCRKPQFGHFVELCCGNGFISKFAATKCEIASCSLVDIHPTAIDFCSNAAGLPTQSPSGHIINYHLHTADARSHVKRIPAGSVDLLVCNPPYIPLSTADLAPTKPETHSSGDALDRWACGVDVLCAVLHQVPALLSKPAGSAIIGLSSISLCSRHVREALTSAAASGLSLSILTEREVPLSVLPDNIPSSCWSEDVQPAAVGGLWLFAGLSTEPRFDYNIGLRADFYRERIANGWG